MKGVCRECGCMEHTACYTSGEGACSWVNEDEDICSSCTDKIAFRIMNMKPGPEMDAEITTIMKDISGEDVEVESFSTNEHSALKLWDFASRAFGNVGIIRMGHAPNLISEYCGIGDGENDNPEVAVFTSSWVDSLAKAFLLFHNDCYGDHENPEYERATADAPKRSEHLS